MATFYGTMKSEGSRSNTKIGQTRITSHTRGWHHGVEVSYRVEGKDAFCEIWETGGSRNPVRVKLIKKFKVKDVSKYRPGSEYFGHVFGGDEVRTA